VREVVGAVPPGWLGPDGADPYVEFLSRRLAAPRAFAAEAEQARRARG